MEAAEELKMAYSALRELFLREGADDVGFAELDRANDLFIKRPEYVYVAPGSKAETAARKNLAKKLRYVGKPKPDSALN